MHCSNRRKEKGKSLGISNYFIQILNLEVSKHTFGKFTIASIGDGCLMQALALGRSLHIFSFQNNLILIANSSYFK